VSVFLCACVALTSYCPLIPFLLFFLLFLLLVDRGREGGREGGREPHTASDYTFHHTHKLFGS